MQIKLLSKKAQVAHTLTWLIATLVIITILVVTFIVSGLFSKLKSDPDASLNSIKNYLSSKSLSSYVLYLGKDELINKKLEEADSFGLGLKIFGEINLPIKWVGLRYFDSSIIYYRYEDNEFFGSGKGGISGGGPNFQIKDFYSNYDLNLNSEKKIEIQFNLLNGK